MRDRRDLAWVLALSAAAFVAGSAYLAVAWSRASASFHIPASPVGLVSKEHWAAYGAVFAAACAAAYALFRTAARPGIAALLTVAFMVSPGHLYQLVPSLLHDYVKAPFILAGAALLLHLGLHRGRSRRDWMRGLAAASTIAGIGAAFRSDVLILLPLVVAVAFMGFPAEGGSRARWAGRARVLAERAGTACGAVALAVAVQAIAVSFGGESPATGKVFGNMSTGFSSFFDPALGIEPGPYAVSTGFLDRATVATGFLQARADEHGRFLYGDAFEEAGRETLSALARTFPADAFARGLGAVGRVLELPFSQELPPLGLDSAWIDALYEVRAAIAGALSGLGWALLAAALGILAARGIRANLIWIMTVGLLGAYPLFQPFDRHLFHLEPLSLWSLGLLLDRAPSWVRARGGISWRQAARPAAIVAAEALALLAVLAGARAIQDSRLGELFASYESAPRSPLALVGRMETPTRVLFTDPAVFPVEAPGIWKRILLVRFADRSCGQVAVVPTFRYRFPVDNIQPEPTHTRVVKLSEKGPTDVYFPVITFPEYWDFRFAGVELPLAQKACLVGAALLDGSFEPGARVIAVLGPGWRRERLHQAPFRWEGGVGDEAPPELLSRPFRPLGAPDYVTLAPVATAEAGSLSVRGRAAQPPDAYYLPATQRAASGISGIFRSDVNIARIDTDLFRTRDFAVGAGVRLLIEGRVERGGVTVGLIRDGENAGSVDLNRIGKFRVLLEVPQPGPYSVGAAHSMLGYGDLETRVRFDRIGWLEPPPRPDAMPARSIFR